ncbi:MAG: hypothetical protein AAGJ34_11805 [Pseudomonadota bacterium]
MKTILTVAALSVSIFAMVAPASANTIVPTVPTTWPDEGSFNGDAGTLKKVVRDKKPS